MSPRGFDDIIAIDINKKKNNLKRFTNDTVHDMVARQYFIERSPAPAQHKTKNPVYRRQFFTHEKMKIQET